MQTTVKTSVSLKTSLWDRLKKCDNKSQIINTALEMFFDREKFLKKADQEYWKQVEASLRSGDGEYISLNPGGRKLTQKDLDEKLWN